MFVAMGWLKIQSSYSQYVGVDPSSEQADLLDESYSRADQALQETFECWLKENADLWFQWKNVSINNHDGYYQTFTSRNHSSSVFWDMMDFVAMQSKGSHGLFYTHDCEAVFHSGGQDYNHTMEYRVWRIFEGKVTEHADPFFSPFTSPHAFGDLPIS